MLIGQILGRAWDVKVSAVLPVAGAILVAVAGYFGTYVNNLRIAQRKDRLDRINRQLSEFYGPLFGLCNTCRITAEEFVKVHTRRVEAEGPQFSAEAGENRWKLWYEKVWMPLKLRMLDIIISKTDLIREPMMPDVLLMACAHIESATAIFAEWERGDATALTWIIAFPDELLTYLAQGFAELKAEQGKLLGASAV
jgi:hypothetical protein